MMHQPGGGSAGAAPKRASRREGIAAAARSLRYRDFRLLWFGTLGNSLMMWMDIVVRNWLVWSITESYAAVATVNIVRMVPGMLLAIPAGVLVDRIDRRQLLVGAQAAIFMLYGVLAALAFSNLLNIWAIYSVFFAMGITSAITQPARQSIIPMVVPREEITNAVALQQAGFNATRIFGMAAAGWFMAWQGPGLVFTLLAVTGGTVVLTSYLLRLPPMPARPTTSPFAAAWQGLGYVAQTPILRVLLLLTFVVMLLGLPFSSLLPGYVAEVFDAGPGAFGMLMSASGIGAFVATLVVASATFRRPGTMVLVGVLLFGMTLVGFAYVPFLAVAAALLGIGGFASGIHMTLSNGLMLTQSDPAYHGRVMSMNMLNHGFMPLGAYPAAWLAGFIGAAFTIAVMGGLLLVCAVAVALAHPGLFKIQSEAARTPSMSAPCALPRAAAGTANPPVAKASQE